MRKLPALIFTAAAGLAVAGLAGTAQAAPAPKMPYKTMAELPIVTMTVYDEKANANQVVDAAMAKAKKEHKLLLIDFGGNWCPDCIVLHNLMLVPAMAKFVDAHYEVALVDVGRYDRNQDLTAHYGLTKRLEGVPALLVIDPQTNKIINQDNVYALRTAGHQTPQALADYLAHWTDPHPSKLADNAN